MNNDYAYRILTECTNDLTQVETIINGLGVTSNIVPYLTKYSIIKSCGIIEVSYKTIIADYCSKRVKQQVKTFINKRLRDSSNNPTYSNICSTLGLFDDEWKNEFKRQIDSHPNKSTLLDSLQSLVDARNDFAHGGNPSASIQDIIRYFYNAKIVIEILDDVVK